MKTKLRVLAVALIAGGTMFAQSRLSIGVGVGGYGPGSYRPPAYAQYQPPCPGPGYSWVDGYWTPEGGRNVWSAGFWRGPAVTVAPRYVEPRYDYAYRDNAYRGNDRDNAYRGNAYRGNDRDDYNRERGHDSLTQSRGSERNHNDNRGNSYGNGFRH